MNERTNEIVKVGGTAAAASVVLAILEALEGVAAGSVEMIIDGLSHISEAGTAVITVIGAKIAGKRPDRKHPYGYGRIEYFSAVIIAMLTIYAGITGIIEGVKAILHPHAEHVSILALAVVAISMVTRIVVGRHDIHVGKHHNSRALLQVGKTELKHSILSLVTLISALVSMLFHVEIGSYIATVISVTIVYSGIIMLRDMVSSLVGERTEKELMQKVMHTIHSVPGVEGVYDLSLNNYGPSHHTGSVHIGILDTMTVNELDKVERQIHAKVMQEHGVFMTGIGIYSQNTHDPKVIEARKKVHDIAMKKQHVEQVHGFYMDEEDKSMRLDLVIAFDAKDAETIRDEVVAEIAAAYPDYTVVASIDADYGSLIN